MASARDATRQRRRHVPTSVITNVTIQHCWSLRCRVHPRVGPPDDPPSNTVKRPSALLPRLLTLLTLKCVASTVFVPSFSIRVTIRLPCSHSTDSVDPGTCTHNKPTTSCAGRAENPRHQSGWMPLRTKTTHLHAQTVGTTVAACPTGEVQGTCLSKTDSEYFSRLAAVPLYFPSNI